ncbi:hypothetical protein MSG28_007365 [Choristoneura fumiferana]|uniref:Uncharacterized protein n=1 Tax=Choristoneura fumiferana TaxID=7141 RepID=A0ACC0JWT3_CHOFU|nr:hypothetical protein MSG28_007365 [Choristoneura fumiferana]
MVAKECQEALSHSPATNHQFLTTDAANYGWGAQLNDMILSGTWTGEQRLWHSNLKELHAIHAALRASRYALRNSTLLIQSDNRTALAYLKNEGGTRSTELLEEVRKILLFADGIHLKLVTQHLPGTLNTVADRLSRGKRLPQWHLSPQACQKIFHEFGIPQIDLFASRQAHVVRRYVSLDPLDHQAEFCNAFSRRWFYRLAWIFPPPSLMPRVLAHLNMSRGIYIVITPRWERTFWRSDLRARALRYPMRIPGLRHHLIDMTTGHPPPNVADLELEAWLVGGGSPF